MPSRLHHANARRPLTPAGLRRRARTRALGGAIAVVIAVTAWAITHRGQDAWNGAGWTSGFLTRDANGRFAEWTPPPGAEQIAGGFTDWSPDVRYDGKPLPDNIVARWWFEYTYARDPVGVAAPLVHRAEFELIVADPNYAPFGEGIAENYASTVRALLRERAQTVGDRDPGDLAQVLRVASPEPGEHSVASIYWQGLPRQAALVALCFAGAVLLFTAIRPAIRARRLGRLDIQLACPRCLYDTNASPARCPECGLPFAGAPASSSA